MRRMEFVLFYFASPPSLISELYALVRDGFRCVISGSVDAESAKQYPNELEAPSATYGVRWTNCAYILPSPTSLDMMQTAQR